MKLLQLLTFTVIIALLTVFTSCREVVIDYDCGEVETEIKELDERVGSYIDSSFTNMASTNYKEAAISILIDNFEIITETETSCFAFTAIPQLIEKFILTSSKSVTIGGVEYSPNEVLNELFKVHVKAETYSMPEFISAQNNEATIFHMDGDEIILQLLNKPDVVINQSIEVEITFDDSKMITVEIPEFEVSN